MGETKLAQNMRKYSEKMATPPWMKCSPSSKNLIRKTVCTPDIFKGKFSNNVNLWCQKKKGGFPSEKQTVM